MEEKNWRALRESGFRTLFVGLFSLVIAFIIYSRLTTPSSDLVRIESQELTGMAWGMLAITVASMASMLHGVYTIFRSERMRTSAAAASLDHTNNLISIITTTFSDRDYWKIMIAAAVAYGIFFGFLSQIFVYRADVSFTEKGIKVPSIDLIPCCAPAGYMPMATFYITDHFLILIIPLNVILATIVSLLVGFNVALSIFAFRSKKSLQTTKTSLAAGIGATSGLFVGCPTCAGSLFLALLGIGIAGAGGTSASVLAPFQTLFIAASIPALLIAPFLSARSVRSSSSSSSSTSRCNVT